MKRPPYQLAQLCALILLINFTLESKGLSRVDHPGYRPANITTYGQKEWNSQPAYDQRQPLPAGSAGGWTGNANGNPVASNQWNRFNQTNPANQWQRFNNTNQPIYPASNSNYSPGLANWSPSPQHPQSPYNATAPQQHWQHPNQTRIYPQLPAPNAPWAGAGGRPLPVVTTTTPGSFNKNQWNGNSNSNNNRWNNSYPAANSNSNPNPNPSNWWLNQNRTSWNAGGVGNGVGGGGIAPTNPTFSNNSTYWRGGPQATSYPGGGANSGIGGTIAGAGYQPAGQANNNNWNYNRLPNTTTSNNWGTNANGVLANPGQSGSWGPGGTINSGSNSWGSGGGGGGGVQPAANWGGGGASGGDNWRNQLAPIGPGQLPSMNGVPLAPIGGSSAALPQSWNAGNNLPLAWNSGGNTGGSGSAQLAPLAPLAYGSGGPIDTTKSNGGNVNPYAKMFI